jgi:hypothetical protein
MMKTQYEQNAFDRYKFGEMYCLDQKNEGMYLKASKDEYVMGHETVFFIIKAGECTEETRITGDPECAP